MDIVNFKQNIYENNKIPDILIALGCHDVKAEQSSKIFTAGLPDGNNRRSVQVRNNHYLDACIRSKGITGIDIFDIVSYIKFHEETKDDMKYSRTLSINWVKRLLDLDLKEYPSVDLEWAKKINSKPKNQILKKSILKQYLPYPNQMWIDEGINRHTQTFFGISYNLEYNQIVIPIYNDEGELIGVKARNLDTNKYDNKYIYLYPCNASMNLYGLHIAKKHIPKINQIILFEGEKSVMKAFQYGFRNTVALGCKDITTMQLSLLKEYINNGTKIILALDKDVYYKNGSYDYKHLKELDSMFKDNNLYAIIDYNDLLEEKDAPVDRGEEVFNQLLNEIVLIKDLKTKKKEGEEAW